MGCRSAFGEVINGDTLDQKHRKSEKLQKTEKDRIYLRRKQGTQQYKRI